MSPTTPVISSALLIQALEAIPDGCVLTDANQNIVAVNRAFTTLTGYTTEEVLGRNCRILQGPQTEPATIQKMGQALRAGQIFQGCVRNYRKDGSTFWNAITITPLRDASGRVMHYVSVQRDETEKHQIWDDLRQQSIRDPLTGLPNRAGLAQHLTLAIARAQRDGKAFAVGIIDLDDFKPINDTWGHAAGDALLRELAQRLQNQLRIADFLARLGGDEFVVVLEGLLPLQIEAQIATLARRLHQAVESPYEVMPSQFAEIGMSLGLALYPGDGQEPDALMRLADAALYEAKIHKADRKHWWHRWRDDSDAPKLLSLHLPSELDAYGAEAIELLSQIQEHLQRVVTQFVREFYAEIHQRREPSAILAQLTADEFVHLQDKQTEHLRQLLSPALSESQHRAQAQQLGQVHALVGMDASEMILAMQDYTSLVHRSIQSLAWRGDRRAELAGVIGERLKHEMHWELNGMRLIEQARQSVLAYLESEVDEWLRQKDGNLAELSLQTILHHLHGLRGAAYGGASAEARIVPIVKVGCANDYLSDLVKTGTNLVFDPNDPQLGQCSTVRAWVTGHITTVANYAAAIELSGIAPIARKHGIRSAATLPIFDLLGNPVGVVTLFGGYPCQFESWSAQLWLRSLQQFFQRFASPISGRRSSIALPSIQERENVRRLLHGGKLQMFMQPLVDLYTGRLVKVEALARLRDGDKWLLPEKFLPAFGEHDLAHLFREGLMQALRWLPRWDDEGIILDLSVNLPPAVLMLPECTAWVSHALSTIGVAPHRLILELLETEEIENQIARDSAITALAALGVQLGMDDLGSGYSGLQRLQSMPFHVVKIDQATVRQAVTTPDKSIPFLGALVRMTQTMGMRVAMEGLESVELIEMAACLGVDWGQGYAIAKPLPPEAILDWAVGWDYTVDPIHPQHALGKRAQTFRRESLPFDWKHAINTHANWNTAFLERINGHGKPLNWKVVCRDDLCHLGRWLYRHRHSCAPELRPLYEETMRAHAQFHQMAGVLTRRAEQDGDVGNVLVEIQNGALNDQSTRLIDLLKVLSAASIKS
jgi:diguanylate cyclase (GGDEF)-like protein/PAS domain S-box-containing protein